MVDHLILDGKVGCLGYNNGKILFAALFSLFFWILYFPMDLASGKIELSERYIQKLKCGHTLQSYNAVVLTFMEKQRYWNAKCDRSHY